MPSPYVKKPPVQCSGDECTNEIQVTKPSKSGRYFCRRPDCRSQRQREWRQENQVTRVDTTAAALEALKARAAEIVSAALHGKRVTCPECERPDALPDELHLTPLGAGCAGTHDGVRTMPMAMAKAIWPFGMKP